ncbi:uncharacterized protein LOC111008157 isoform X2 [Momordica charantia]|uniref:Uncharacterized protein LOC111008157 isoform X2 n=1 Tax=Momordica charantia TaxID=3673 RepID=A0A6J1C3J3_MOMCH|nr:uncharacterized protein LOC111008157 isoform X2 [Momordica charantia]
MDMKWRVASERAKEGGKRTEATNVMKRLFEEERYMRNNCGLHHILSYLCSFLPPTHFLSSLESYGCAWYSIAVRARNQQQIHSYVEAIFIS